MDTRIYSPLPSVQYPSTYNIVLEELLQLSQQNYLQQFYVLLQVFIEDMKSCGDIVVCVIIEQDCNWAELNTFE